jgi:hypothetical protein
MGSVEESLSRWETHSDVEWLKRVAVPSVALDVALVRAQA